jgi:hypothetical protein
MHWILIVNSPHYGNVTDNGIPAGQNGCQSGKKDCRIESHAIKNGRHPREDERQSRKVECKFEGNERGNKIWPS